MREFGTVLLPLVVAGSLFGQVRLTSEVAVDEVLLVNWINEDWAQAKVQWSLSHCKRQSPAPAIRYFHISGKAQAGGALSFRVGTSTSTVEIIASATAADVARNVASAVAGYDVRVMRLTSSSRSDQAHAVVVLDSQRHAPTLEVLSAGDAPLAFFVAQPDEKDCVLTDQEAAFLAARHEDSDSSSLDLIVVRESRMGDGSKLGRAYLPGWAWANTAFVVAPRTPRNTSYDNGRVPSHELGHVLLGTEDHLNKGKPCNLMHENPIKECHHLTDNQRIVSRASVLLAMAASSTNASCSGDDLQWTTCCDAPQTPATIPPPYSVEQFLCYNSSAVYHHLYWSPREAKNLVDRYPWSSSPHAAGCQPRISEEQLFALALLASQGGGDAGRFNATVRKLPQSTRRDPAVHAAIEILRQYFADRRAYSEIPAYGGRVEFLEQRLLAAYDPISGSAVEWNWLSGGHPTSRWALKEWARQPRRAIRRHVRAHIRALEYGITGPRYHEFLRRAARTGR